jgi:HAD superfamily hydrolase (TIGR01509 family)
MDALIFDCDGVLVDTERDGHRVAFNAAFAGAGLQLSWSIERYAQLLTTGGGKERMIRHFDEVGWPKGCDDKSALIALLHKNKTELFSRLIESGALPLRPGVSRLVDEAIAAGVTLAVCSTSNEKSVRTIVENMLGHHRAQKITIFAGDVVAAKKPDPAIYSLAASTMGLVAKKCVVIEDSHIGLQAAKAAGMNCIVTMSPYTADEDFELADRVVLDLDQGINLTLCRSIVETRLTK